MTITGRGGIAVTVLMAMDLLCFPMVLLALIALSMDIFGYSVLRVNSLYYGDNFRTPFDTISDQRDI